MSAAQKEAVLSVVKSFSEPEDEKVNIPKQVMDEIWKDREDYLNGVGKNYSWKEVKEFIRTRHQKKA